MPTLRWLPQPLLSLVLLLTWLLLTNSVTAGHILLGALLGVVIPYFSVGLWPQRPHLRRPITLFRLIVRLLGDIVIANLVVARLILGSVQTLQPRFIDLPLDLKNRFAITLLAHTISLTPGTVSADLSPDYQHLLIHCLNVDDEAALITQIKARYEAPLKEIFESC
jgi:multicomponent K+:H+ antiporter subunit E